MITQLHDLAEPPRAEVEAHENARDPLAVADVMVTTRRIARALSAIALVVGLLTSAAWLGPSVFARLHAVFAMKLNTALAISLLGAANLVYLGHRAPPWARRLARSLPIIVGAIGTLTLAEYIAGWDLGIDQAFVAEHPAFSGGAHPGRMGSNTALVLVLLAVAFALRDRPSPRVRVTAEASAIGGTLIATLAIIGHLLGARTLYAVGFHTQMAAQTSAALLALSIGFLLSHGDRGLVSLITSTGSGGFMARRMIPLIVAVPTLAGWLSISGVRAHLYDAELGMSIDVVLAIAALLVVVLLSARTLNRVDDLRRRGEERILALNERLVRHARDLEEANQQLESFSYSVSHDLRAPIRHIGGFTELLEKQTKDVLDQKSRHYMATISESARRAGALIDDLLAFSRMSRAEMKMAPVDMKRCVDSAWRDLTVERASRNVELVVGPMPRVMGDASMLHLVFANLLSNALKYTRPREKARIEITSQTEGDEVTFMVRDNGVGFDMRYVDKLFGVFQRLHKSDAFEGVGIGLANVHRIVHRHGGRVWAEGKVGEGAAFYFTLPKGGAS